METGHLRDASVPPELLAHRLTGKDRKKAFMIACTTYPALPGPSMHHVKLTESDMQQQVEEVIGTEVVDRHNNSTRIGEIVAAAVDSKKRLWTKYTIDDSVSGRRALEHARQGKLKGTSWRLHPHRDVHHTHGVVVVHKMLENLSLTDDPEYPNDALIYYISDDSPEKKEAQRLFDIGANIARLLHASKQTANHTSATNGDMDGNKKRTHSEMSEDDPAAASSVAASATTAPADNAKAPKKALSLVEQLEQIERENERLRKQSQTPGGPTVNYNFGVGAPAANGFAPETPAAAAAAATVAGVKTPTPATPSASSPAQEKQLPPTAKTAGAGAQKQQASKMDATQFPGFDDEQLKKYNDFLAFQEQQKRMEEKREAERLDREAKEVEARRVAQLREQIRQEELAKLNQAPAAAAAAAIGGGGDSHAAEPSPKQTPLGVPLSYEEIERRMLEKLRAEVLKQPASGSAADDGDDDEDVEDKVPAKSSSSNNNNKKKAAAAKKAGKTSNAAVGGDGASSSGGSDESEPMPVDGDEKKTPAAGGKEAGKLFESGSAASDALNQYAQARNAMQESENKYKALASGMPPQMRNNFEKQLAEQREHVKQYQQQLMKATVDTELAFANKMGTSLKESKKKQYADMMARDVLDDKDLFFIEATMDTVCESSAAHDRTLEKAERDNQKLRDEYARKQLADQMAMDELKSNNANVNEAFGAFKTIFGEAEKSRGGGAFRQPSSGFIPPPARGAGSAAGDVVGMETDGANRADSATRFNDSERPGPSEFSEKYGYYAKVVDPEKPKRPDVWRMQRPATIDSMPMLKGRRLQHVRPLESLQKQGMDEQMWRAFNIARQEGLNGCAMRFGTGDDFFISKHVAKNFQLLDGAVDRGGLQMLPDEVSRPLPENFKKKLVF